MINRLFMITFFGFYLIGCSFSKSNETNNGNIEYNKIDETIVSQNNIISAIERNDVEKLRKEIQRARSSELTFSEYSITPMGAALKTNNFEMAKLLFDLNIDPFNLGNQTSIFNELSSPRALKNLYSKINFQEKSNKIEIRENKIVDFIISKYAEKSKIILEALESNNLQKAKSEFILARLNCSVLELGLIYDFQINARENFKTIESFLTSIACKPNLAPAIVSQLYMIETARQFQNRFTEGELLSYLSRHPNLPSLMFELDKSGILISPKLAYRSILTSEYQRVSEETISQYCNRNMNAETVCESSESDKDFSFFTNYNITIPPFEIIILSNGRLSKSLKYFVPARINDADIFFEKLCAWLMGKRLFRESVDPNDKSRVVETEIQWEIGFQTWEDDVTD